jgi:Ni/Fe-hydrogenase subunit HybB-like protein
VFAVFLVVAASGALNVASMASVFGKTEFKPLAPLSGLLAIALLLGGLTVLMLDLGRPDRLIVAMTPLQLQVDLRLEHLPLFGLHRDRRSPTCGP